MITTPKPLAAPGAEGSPSVRSDPPWRIAFFAGSTIRPASINISVEYGGISQPTSRRQFHLWEKVPDDETQTLRRCPRCDTTRAFDEDPEGPCVGSAICCACLAEKFSAFYNDDGRCDKCQREGRTTANRTALPLSPTEEAQIITAYATDSLTEAHRERLVEDAGLLIRKALGA